MNDRLDQLWYTWSASGLGTNAIGYRVRAASDDLHDMQSLRYRKLDRYLRYELPQGINFADANPDTTPVSLAFVTNGEERLLVRKVFKGKDASGRQSVYFSHLIAGLPPDFTAREAICLWSWPGWSTSDQGKAANDTYLKTISYSEIRAAVQASPPQDFSLVRQQLTQILQIILTLGMPSPIYLAGPSALNAAFIYGLTHALPMTLLKNPTFTTYESVAQGREENVIGTITAAEMAQISLQVVLPSQFTMQGVQISQDIQDYIQSALDHATSEKFRKMLAVAESQQCTDPGELLEIYKLRYIQGPLKPKQLNQIVRYPQDNRENLLDPEKQQKAAALLVQDPRYWPEDGKRVFGGVLERLRSTPTQNQELARFLEGVVEAVLNEMEGAIRQFSGDWTLLKQCCEIFGTLAHPSLNAAAWNRLLLRFAQEPLYSRILSDPLWGFQNWVLQNATMMKPEPEEAQIRPWLSIASWEKLQEVLNFSPALPASWERMAIAPRIANGVPKTAMPTVQKHEATFKEVLRYLLQTSNPQANAVVVGFIKSLVEHQSANRADWLIFLSNSSKNPLVVGPLFASVPFYSESQLTAPETERVLEAWSAETLVACATVDSVIVYISEYVYHLMPDKLARPAARQLLRCLSKERLLPPELMRLIVHWLWIARLFESAAIKKEELVHIGEALQAIMQIRPQETASFAGRLIALLVKQAQNILDILDILEALGPSMAGSRWALLRSMAQEAGRTYAQHHDLSRLTLYMYVGICEAARSQQPQMALDDYLRTLYASVGNDGMKQTDDMVHSEAWPEDVWQDWNGWRKREAEAGRGGGWFGIGKRRTNSQPGTAAGGQPYTPPAQPNMQPVSPPVQYSPAPMPQQGQGQLVLSNNQATFQPAGQPASGGQGYATHTQKGQQPPQAAPASAAQKVPDLAVFSVANQSASITYESYQKAHHIMKYTLAYWIYYLHEIQKKKTSKSLTTEIELVREIMRHIQTEQTRYVVKELLEYLVDDALIRSEIERVIKEQRASPAFFDASGRLQSRLQELQAYDAGAYQKLISSFQMPDIYLVLSLLIRRILFLDYLDGERTKLHVWLEKERRGAKIRYSV